MRLLRNWWRLGAAFALLAVMAAALFAFLPVRADMTILLPEERSGDLALLFRSLREGPANRTILIGVGTGTHAELPEPRAISRALKQSLEKTGRFEWIANGEFRQDLSAIAPFFAHRYQLNPPLDPAQFTAEGLRAGLERLLDLLHGIAAPVVGEIMAADPTLRTLAVASQWMAPSARTRQGVWIDGEGRRALLVAQAGGAGFDLTAQAATVAAVRDAAAGLEAKFGKLDVALSGPSAIAVESRRIAEAESQRLGLISVPLVAGLLLLTLRRIAALPILFLPFGVGFVAASALVGAVFGYVHATTLGFGMTLLGVAVDYPLHLMAHTKEGVGAAEAARKISGRLLIAVSTTVLAFLPLLLSSFPGLAQLGVFSVAGLAVAALVTRWLLPHLIAPASGALYRADGKALRPIHRWMRLLRMPALAAGIAAVAVLTFRAEPLWQHDLTALSPIPEAIRAQDQALRRNLTAADPRHVVTVSAKTVEEAMERSERLLPRLAALKDAKELDGYEMAALYVPSRAAQRARFAALPSEESLRANLNRAQEGLPFRPGAFEPFLHAVAAAKAAEPLDPLDLEDLTLRARLEPLLLHSDDEVKALILLRGLRNPAGLRKSIGEAGVEGASYLDLKQSAETLMDGYRAETLRWVLLGAALSLVLLAASLRSARAVFAVTVPVLLSVAVTAAILAVVAGGLTIFHLVGLLMVGGLSVDYAVFLREDDAEGDSLRGVALCFGTDLAGFALLASAAVPILSQIGLTVAVGCTLSFLFGLAFTAPRRGRPV